MYNCVRLGDHPINVLSVRLPELLDLGFNVFLGGLIKTQALPINEIIYTGYYKNFPIMKFHDFETTIRFFM